MSLVSAIVVGALFGAGIDLITRRDAIKVAAGTLLLTNSVILLLVAGEFSDFQAPFVPLAQLEEVADPLLQALALTAIVIGFGTTVLLFRITMAVARSHDTIDMEELVDAQNAAKDSAAPSRQEER